MASPALSSNNLVFYRDEDASYSGWWQDLISPGMAVSFLHTLAYCTGEEMPTIHIEPNGGHHMADENNIWILADDLRTITLCHEFAHVIQCRNSDNGKHDMDFATLVCLMASIAEGWRWQPLGMLR